MFSIVVAADDSHVDHVVPSFTRAFTLQESPFVVLVKDKVSESIPASTPFFIHRYSVLTIESISGSDEVTVAVRLFCVIGLLGVMSTLSTEGGVFVVVDPMITADDFNQAEASVPSETRISTSHESPSRVAKEGRGERSPKDG